MIACLTRCLAFAMAVTACLGQLSAQDTTLDGRQLYQQLCAACHGKSGLGDGRAARFVVPSPRNLRHAPFRLVSTINRVPTAEDIRRVIEAGMPGTAMQAWKDLGQAKLDALVQTVLEFRVRGAAERYETVIRETTGETPAASDLDEAAYIQRVTVPGEVWHYDVGSPADEELLQRGAEVYKRQKCNSCHGDDARGSRGMDLVDLNGRPTWALDLRRDRFHGGHLPADVARRIYLGMPGSGMPSSTNLSTEDLRALVAYSLSLAENSQVDLTNHLRRERAIGRLLAP